MIFLVFEMSKSEQIYYTSYCFLNLVCECILWFQWGLSEVHCGSTETLLLQGEQLYIDI